MLNPEAAYIINRWHEFAQAMDGQRQILNDITIFLIYKGMMTMEQSLRLEGISFLMSAMNLIIYISELLNRES